MTLIFRLSNHA